MKNVKITTNWDKKTKKGGWAAICNNVIISGSVLNTTSDKLALTAMDESTKKFGNGGGDTLNFVINNYRVINAIRHPSNSVNCQMARQFKATMKASGSRYTFNK